MHSSTLAEDDLRDHLTKQQQSATRPGGTVANGPKSNKLLLEDITEVTFPLHMQSLPVNVDALKALTEMLAPFETYITNGIMEAGLPIEPWEVEDVECKLRESTANWVHETFGVGVELV